MRMTCNTHGEVDGLPHSNGDVYCPACVGAWQRRELPTPQQVPVEPNAPRTPKRRTPRPN
jgi:hypothetical protein